MDFNIKPSYKFQSFSNKIKFGEVDNIFDIKYDISMTLVEYMRRVKS